MTLDFSYRGCNVREPDQSFITGNAKVFYTYDVLCIRFIRLHEFTMHYFYTLI